MKTLKFFKSWNFEIEFFEYDVEGKYYIFIFDFISNKVEKSEYCYFTDANKDFINQVKYHLDSIL